MKIPFKFMILKLDNTNKDSGILGFRILAQENYTSMREDGPFSVYKNGVNVKIISAQIPQIRVSSVLTKKTSNDNVSVHSFNFESSRGLFTFHDNFENSFSHVTSVTFFTRGIDTTYNDFPVYIPTAASNFLFYTLHCVSSKDIFTVKLFTINKQDPNLLVF